MLPVDQITAVLFVGVTILIGSLAPISRVLKATPNKRLRRSWIGLGLMVGGFVAGYAVVAVTLPRTADHLLLKGVCAVLLSGSVFVWVVARLAEWTAAEVARLTLREAEAITDPLTGLHNRRYFDERLHEECLRSTRSGSMVAVAMIDIDRFKGINDTYGHPAGDQVLVSVATALKCAMRRSDILARYGGEEFALLAPDIESAQLGTFCQRLVEAVSETKTTLHSGETLEVTASIGATSQARTNARELVARADMMLYRAKHAGRNRVVIDPVPDERPEATNGMLRMQAR